MQMLLLKLLLLLLLPLFLPPFLWWSQQWQQQKQQQLQQQLQQQQHLCLNEKLILIQFNFISIDFVFLNFGKLGFAPECRYDNGHGRSRNFERPFTPRTWLGCPRNFAKTRFRRFRTFRFSTLNHFFRRT